MEEIKKRIDINFSQIGQHIINNAEFYDIFKEHTDVISDCLAFIRRNVSLQDYDEYRIYLHEKYGNIIKQTQGSKMFFDLFRCVSQYPEHLDCIRDYDGRHTLLLTKMYDNNLATRYFKIMIYRAMRAETNEDKQIYYKTLRSSFMCVDPRTPIYTLTVVNPSVNCDLPIIVTVILEIIVHVKSHGIKVKTWRDELFNLTNIWLEKYNISFNKCIVKDCINCNNYQNCSNQSIFHSLICVFETYLLAIQDIAPLHAKSFYSWIMIHLYNFITNIMFAITPRSSYDEILDRIINTTNKMGNSDLEIDNDGLSNIIKIMENIKMILSIIRILNILPHPISEEIKPYIDYGVMLPILPST